jgi:hypothetical protein
VEKGAIRVWDASVLSTDLSSAARSGALSFFKNVLLPGSGQYHSQYLVAAHAGSIE